MSNNLIGSIFEFVVGFFLVPVIEGIINFLYFLFVVGKLGIGMSFAPVFFYIVEIILLIFCFRYRKTIGFGYLASLIINLFFDFNLLSYFKI